MLPFFSDNYGNPSSLHTTGKEANIAVQNARKQVASLIEAKDEEIIFTSGGTESNNLALFGIAYANKSKGNHIITSCIEHPAILNMCKFLEGNGFNVTYLSVDRYGLVDSHAVEAAILPETILISIMTVNTEIGTIQPIEDIGRIAKTHNVYFHTDAVGGIGQVKIDVEKMGLNLLSMNSHKIHGPKGVGALYVKNGTNLQGLIIGGGQEHEMRGGTENVPGIVGMGKACEITAKDLDENIVYMTCLRDKLINGILKINNVYINGHLTQRAPNNVSVRFSNINGQSLLVEMNRAGIEVSIGCACLSKKVKNLKDLNPYTVLLECGLSIEEAKGSIRMTISKLNSEEEIDYVLKILPNIVKMLRSK
jgi:cysteine desulfurase